MALAIHVVTGFIRLGVYVKTDEIVMNNKFNTIISHRPPKQGENYFMDTLADNLHFFFSRYIFLSSLLSLFLSVSTAFLFFISMSIFHVFLLFILIYIPFFQFL